MPPVQKAAPAAPVARPAEHTAHPEPTPAPKSKKASASRSYAAAEAALNERIRADHIWLSNPVLVRGLGMARSSVPRWTASGRSCSVSPR